LRGACATDLAKNGMRVEAAHPPKDIIAQVERIAARIGLDIGGIEYLVDARDGKPYFYDVNALSNFVADAVNVIGNSDSTATIVFLDVSGPATAAEYEQERKSSCEPLHIAQHLVGLRFGLRPVLWL